MENLCHLSDTPAYHFDVSNQAPNMANDMELQELYANSSGEAKVSQPKFSIKLCGEETDDELNIANQL